MNDLTPHNTLALDVAGSKAAMEDAAGPRPMRPLLLVLQGVLALGIVSGAGFAMQAMLAEREAPQQRPVREQSFTIETVPASRATHQPRLTVYGDIVAGNRIELRGSVGGTVMSVHKDLQSGALVEAGAALVALDAFPFETALSEAQIAVDEAEARVAEAEARRTAYARELQSAEAQLTLAEEDLSRADTLLARGSVTQQTVDQRRQTLIQRRASVDQVRANQTGEEARLRQQRAALARAELQVSRAARNLAETQIAAPVTGIIETESVALGQTITANQSIATLIELDALEARFILSDAQYGRIAANLIGTPVDVIWATGAEERAYQATITRTGAAIRQDQGGVTVFARLSLGAALTNGGFDIRPGAFVSVSLMDRAYVDSYRVPETALYDENRIYVVDGERLASVFVTPLAFDGDTVILRSDLVEGSQIMITRIAEAGDGLKIRIAGAPRQRGSRPARGAGQNDEGQDTGDQGAERSRSPS